MTTQFDVADAALIRSVIQRVATGPELSKNISRDEASATMHALLDGSADPVQAGIFLIGLRMKRETDEEMKGVLDAILDRSTVVQSGLPDVVDVSDPYNGYNRTMPPSLFVLPVLAACGLPAYSHGVEMMGPKFGVTHHTVLKALGGDPLLSVQAVNDRLANPAVGWGYVDQSRFCPALHALTDLRTRIVKRPVLTTVEVLAGPLKAGRTHLMTGFVHKPYPPIYSMLARYVGFDSVLLVRGTEGGIIPSFRQRGRVVRYFGTGPDEEIDIEPGDIDLRRDYRAADIPDSLARKDENASEAVASEAVDRVGLKWDIDALSMACAMAGKQALSGEAGPAFDGVVFGAALALWHAGSVQSLEHGADAARAAIASGAARERLENGLAA